MLQGVSTWRHEWVQKSLYFLIHYLLNLSCPAKRDRSIEVLPNLVVRCVCMPKVQRVRMGTSI